MKTLENKPIGAWVKMTNDVFTNLTRRTENNGSFNRLEWQFLNHLFENRQITKNKLYSFLDFFTNKNEIQKLIDRFKMESLIQIEQNTISITEKGISVYKEVLAIQENIQTDAMKNISWEDYDTTLKTLRQMMDNLKEYSK